MSIVNLSKPQRGESLSVYRIRYEYSSLVEKEQEVNVLAPNVDGAVALFAAFYQARVVNPREMTAANEETRKNCQTTKIPSNKIV